MDYRKQYWKLKVQHRELQNDISYCMATDFCTDCPLYSDDYDSANCCKNDDSYADNYDYEFDALQRLERLIDYAYKRCDGNVQPMPSNFGKARSIYDLDPR